MCPPHENPAMRVASYQYRFSLKVWAKIVGPYLLGPVFLLRLTGETYLPFDSNIITVIGRIFLDTFENDGALLHFQRNVNERYTLPSTSLHILRR